MSDLKPGPARSPESSDWRFAVLCLLVLVLAVLATALVLYIQNGDIPVGFGNLISALTGALIVIIGKRMM